MYDEDVYKNKMTIFYGVLLKSYYIIIIYIIFYIIIHYAIYWKFLRFYRFSDKFWFELWNNKYWGPIKVLIKYHVERISKSISFFKCSYYERFWLILNIYVIYMSKELQSYRQSLFSKTNRANQSVYKIIIKMFL